MVKYEVSESGRRYIEKEACNILDILPHDETPKLIIAGINTFGNQEFQTITILD